MIRTLGKQLKEFRKDSILTPCFMIIEVIMEMVIPLMMASIIDQGVNINELCKNIIEQVRYKITNTVLKNILYCDKINKH